MCESNEEVLVGPSGMKGLCDASLVQLACITHGAHNTVNNAHSIKHSVVNHCSNEQPIL